MPEEWTNRETNNETNHTTDRSETVAALQIARGNDCDHFTGWRTHPSVGRAIFGLFFPTFTIVIYLSNVGHNVPNEIFGYKKMSKWNERDHLRW